MSTLKCTVAQKATLIIKRREREGQISPLTWDEALVLGACSRFPEAQADGQHRILDFIQSATCEEAERLCELALPMFEALQEDEFREGAYKRFTHLVPTVEDLWGIIGDEDVDDRERITALRRLVRRAVARDGAEPSKLWGDIARCIMNAPQWARARRILESFAEHAPLPWHVARVQDVLDWRSRTAA